MPGWFERSAPRPRAGARSSSSHAGRTATRSALRTRSSPLTTSATACSSRTSALAARPAASATRASTRCGARAGVQPPAVRRRCSRTRPSTFEQRPLVGRQRPEAHVDERLRVDLDAGRGAQAQRRGARGWRGARPGRRPGTAASKASVSRRSSAAGSLAQPAPSVSASSSASSGLPLGQPAPGEDRRRPRRAAAWPRRTARSASVSAAGPSQGVATSACEEPRIASWPEPQPARLALAEERQPAAALAVAGPERLDLVEVPAVDLVEDLQQPRLLGLEEASRARTAGSARSWGSRSGRRSRRGCGPRPRPSRAPARRAGAACSRGSRGRRARRPGAAPAVRLASPAPPRPTSAELLRGSRSASSSATSEAGRRPDASWTVVPGGPQRRARARRRVSSPASAARRGRPGPRLSPCSSHSAPARTARGASRAPAV